MTSLIKKLRNNLEIKAELCKYFSMTLSEVEELSIEEIEIYLEIRNKEVEEHNRRVAR